MPGVSLHAIVEVIDLTVLYIQLIEDADEQRKAQVLNALDDIRDSVVALCEDSPGPTFMTDLSGQLGQS